MKNPCCIDFIGAQHIPCDSIFHFGDTCFSNSNHATISVHYILPKSKANSEAVLISLGKLEEKNLTVFFDCEYQYLENEPGFQKYSVCTVKLKSKDPDPKEKEEILGRWVQRKENMKAIVFIGSFEATVLKAMSMAMGKYGYEKVYCIDPSQEEDLEAKLVTTGNSLVLKRYFLIEKAQVNPFSQMHVLTFWVWLAIFLYFACSS